jgi:hypothetical protein
MSYQEKYLKYKAKYLALRKQLGGNLPENIFQDINEKITQELTDKPYIIIDSFSVMNNPNIFNILKTVEIKTKDTKYNSEYMELINKIEKLIADKNSQELDKTINTFIVKYLFLVVNLLGAKVNVITVIKNNKNELFFKKYNDKYSIIGYSETNELCKYLINNLKNKKSKVWTYDESIDKQKVFLPKTKNTTIINNNTTIVNNNYGMSYSDPLLTNLLLIDLTTNLMFDAFIFDAFIIDGIFYDDYDMIDFPIDNSFVGDGYVDDGSFNDILNVSSFGDY